MSDNDNIRSPLKLALIAAGVAALGIALWFAFSGKSADSSVMTSAERNEAINAAGINGTEKAGIEAIVHQYLLDHPEVIPEAMDELSRRQNIAQIGSARSALETPFKQGFIGKADAAITIVEFSDYACGYCKTSVEDVARLVKENPDVKLVVREVPILSEQSRIAALWGLAAADQGKYDAFHNGLFAIGKPTNDNILAAAQQAGMDIPLARKQIATQPYADEVNSNLELMRQVGGSGTPTFVIGEQIIPGAVGYEALEEAVNKARDAQKG